jgi:hypothetical protein
MVASRVHFPVLVVTALQVSVRRVSGNTWPTTAFLVSQQAKSSLINQRLFSNFSVLKMSAKPSYFLLKSEPDEFSIEDLRDCPNGEHEWDGVRNYQARNIFEDHENGRLCLLLSLELQSSSHCGQGRHYSQGGTRSNRTRSPTPRIRPQVDRGELSVGCSACSARYYLSSVSNVKRVESISQDR